MDKINEIFNIISNANSVLITAHIDPDGDAIGSSLAMYNYLKNIGKDVTISVKRVSNNFSFLPRFNEILDENKLKTNYDVIIVLDCGDITRVDIELEKYNCTNMVVIDHHITHEQFSQNTILNTDACATCEIIYDLFTNFNVEITKEIADCIYTGILTDTGSFRHSNVSPHTFEVAKQLLEIGVDNSQIAQEVLDTMSLNKFELVKIALNSIEIIDGKIAYLFLDKDILDKYSQNEDGIHEGIVNYGRNIDEIEVSVFVRQLEENEYKVSMRANRYVDVAQIASKLGGGGHIRAAGAKYVGNLDELKSILLTELKEQL